MALRTTPASPSHKPASDAPAGRRVQDAGNILVNSRAARIPNPQEKQLAADQMRYQLYLLDRSAQRMSIEDCVAALLERSSSELPS
jgi:hypothetical protein